MRLNAMILAMAIAAPVLAAAPNTIDRAAYESGTILLWAGNDLAGWQAPGGNWAAKDGAIVRTRLRGDIWLRNARFPGAIAIPLWRQGPARRRRRPGGP